MFRAFLIAIGISMCIIGGECLVVDQAVFAYPNKSPDATGKSVGGGQDPFLQQSNSSAEKNASNARREIKPPEWAPWSFLFGGVVIALYALTVQRE